MKKTLLVVVVMALIIGLTAGSALAKSDNGKGQGQGQELQLQTETQEFTDVEGHWAAWAIKKANAKGFLKGYGDGSFGPEDFMTNAQALVLLDKLTADGADEDDDAEEDDGDTEADKKVNKDKGIDREEDSLGNAPPWARSSVQDAVYNGYIKRFHSETQCERAYFMVLLAMAMEHYDEDNNVEEGSVRLLPELDGEYFNPFEDLEDFEGMFTGGGYDTLELEPSDIYDYLLRLHQAGIIKGSDGNLNPNGGLKRGEMAILLDKVSEYLDIDLYDDDKDKDKDNEDEEDQEDEDDEEDDTE